MIFILVFGLKMCQNFIFILNQASYVNSSCTVLCLHLRAVNTNRRLFVCKSLCRLSAIKKESCKERKKLEAIHDSSREKKVNLLIFPLDSNFWFTGGGEHCREYWKHVQPVKRQKTKSKCHKNGICCLAAGCLCFLCFVYFLVFQAPPEENFVSEIASYTVLFFSLILNKFRFLLTVKPGYLNL